MSTPAPQGSKSPRYGLERSPFIGDAIEECPEDLVARLFPPQEKDTTVMSRLVPYVVLGLFQAQGINDASLLGVLSSGEEIPLLQKLHGGRTAFSLVKETLETFERKRMLLYWQGYKFEQLMPLVKEHSGESEEDFEKFSQKLEELPCYEVDDF